MMRFPAIFLAIFLLGCVVRPVENPTESKLLQLPEEEKEAINDKGQETPEAKPGDDPEENDPIALFSAADQSGIPEQQHWSQELLIDTIVMEIISEWDDGAKYHVAIKFINPRDESINANLNLYAYDRMGRLVRTEFGGSINFRPRSVMTEEYTFPKRGREVRWIFTLTGKD